MNFDDAWLGDDPGFSREHDSEGKLVAFSCQVGQVHTRVDLKDLKVTSTESFDPELTAEEWLDGWRFRLLESLRPPSFDPKCGFCGKSDREVAKLIAGPSVMICNECIQLCSEILGES